MRYRITPAAKFDLDQIWSYIEEHSGSAELADQVTENIYQQIVLLSRYPHLGRDRSADLDHGFRSFVVGEYVIVYRVRPESDVLILRVVHGRRDLEAIFGH
jgi:plasmid stabilization system protein ParE